MAQMVMAQMEMDQNVFVMGLTMEMVMETMTTTEIMEIMAITVTMATMAIILTFMLHQKLQHLVEMEMDPIVIAMDLKDQMDPVDQMDQMDQMDLTAQTEMDPVDFVRRSHVKSVSQ